MDTPLIYSRFILRCIYVNFVVIVIDLIRLKFRFVILLHTSTWGGIYCRPDDSPFDSVSLPFTSRFRPKVGSDR